MRKILGWALVIAAAAALLPLWAQAWALSTGRVDTPATDPARYRISANESLVSCRVPSTIVLQAGTAATGGFIQCTNKYASAVTLTWSVQDDGGGGFLTASGSAALTANGLAACQDATLTAGAVEGTRTVLLRGETASSAGFYVEIYFSGDVTVQAGTAGLGGGCP